MYYNVDQDKAWILYLGNNFTITKKYGTKNLVSILDINVFQTYTLFFSIPGFGTLNASLNICCLFKLDFAYSQTCVHRPPS